MRILSVQTILFLCAAIVPCLDAYKTSVIQRSSKFFTVGDGRFDFDQCDRRCKWVYGNSQRITGTRLLINECQCHDGEQKIGTLKRDNDYDPPVMPKTGG